MDERGGVITEPSRETPVFGRFEVVVLGGGPAGIAAATAAGKAGRSTILIERYGFLGGAGTAAGVTTFCGLHANVFGEHRRIVHGIADDLLGRMERLGGLNKPHLSLRGMIQAQAYDTSAYKLAGDDLLRSAGVAILFHALAVGIHKASEERIEALILETKSGRLAVRGELFIDCSGDGDLAAWAGAPYEFGDNNGGMLYPSTMFRINGVDPERAANAWEVIPVRMREIEERTGKRFPRRGPIVRPQASLIEWRANVTQIRNPDGSPVSGIDVAQLSWGEVEGRRQVVEMFDFIKAEIPGFEKSYIVDIAPQIGIRETRRISGAYMLTEDDVLSCADFDDTIGVNGWPIERHVAGDVLIRFPPIPRSRGFNQLPYRMIVPRKVTNLFVAGRCASMTHEGQSAARVTGGCLVMGQAAGTAADMVLSRNVTPAGIDVPALQARLAAGGAYLGTSV